MLWWNFVEFVKFCWQEFVFVGQLVESCQKCLGGWSHCGRLGAKGSFHPHLPLQSLPCAFCPPYVESSTHTSPSLPSVFLPSIVWRAESPYVESFKLPPTHTSPPISSMCPSTSTSTSTHPHHPLSSLPCAFLPSIRP